MFANQNNITLNTNHILNANANYETVNNSNTNSSRAAQP